jgi:GR25 family glycosyltransferase involved in LPS biosynthesis
MKRICLNLNSRPDRWEQSQEEFKRVGIEGVERFAAIEHENKFLSFNLSQKAILESINEDTWVFEDDVKFINTNLKEEIFKHVPNDWDILYLGANVLSNIPAVNKYWWKCLDAWTTHAICYRNGVQKKILEVFDVNGYTYDDQLRTKVLPNVNAYVCKPFLAVQRSGYSDLWQREADYSAAFNESQKKLL